MCVFECDALDYSTLLQSHIRKEDTAIDKGCFVVIPGINRV